MCFFAVLALAVLLSAVPAAAEALDHVLVLTWGLVAKVVGTAWHSAPITRDACYCAPLLESSGLQTDVAHTSHFSGGDAAPHGEDRVALKTYLFGGASFAEFRPIPY